MLLSEPRSYPITLFYYQNQSICSKHIEQNTILITSRAMKFFFCRQNIIIFNPKMLLSNINSHVKFAENRKCSCKRVGTVLRAGTPF